MTTRALRQLRQRALDLEPMVRATLIYRIERRDTEYTREQLDAMTTPRLLEVAEATLDRPLRPVTNVFDLIPPFFQRGQRRREERRERLAREQQRRNGPRAKVLDWPRKEDQGDR